MLIKSIINKNNECKKISALQGTFDIIINLGLVSQI